MVKISVIENQRKVVARLDNCSQDAYNILRKRLPDFMTICPEMVAMKNTFKATAKCHPDDEFDVEKGAALAKERVIAKYDAAMQKILTRVGYHMDNYLSYIDNRLDYFEDRGK